MFASVDIVAERDMLARLDEASIRTFYERLRAAGKPPRLALVGAIRKLLHVIYRVAKNRRQFQMAAEQEPTM